MQEQFLKLLRADAAIAAIFEDRINWVVRPQEDSVLPAMTISRVGKTNVVHTKGATDTSETRVQMDIWGESYTQAVAGVRALVALLNAYRGIYEGVNFQGIFLENERDFSDKGNEAKETLFRISLDALVWHS